MQVRIRLLLLSLSIVCASCGDNLRPEPVSNRSLGGNWQTTAAQRDVVVAQLQAALHAAETKQLNRDRKHNARQPATTDSEAMEEHARNSVDAMDASMDSGGASGHYRWELRELREQRQALLAKLQPTLEMKIEQTAGRIDITSFNTAHRSFEPGVPSTLVTTFARLYIQSGWQDDEFIVHSKDRDGNLDQVERYQRLSSGSLRLSVTLSVRNMKTQHYSLIYQLSDAQ